MEVSLSDRHHRRSRTISESRQRSKALNDSASPGCMPGLLHFLDLHQRLHIKKTLAYRLPNFDRIRSPKKKQNLALAGDENEVEKEAIVSPSETSPHSIKSKETAVIRSFPTALVKNLIIRKRHREKDKKQSTSPMASKMMRTLSIHHLESNEYVPPEELTSQNECSTSGLNSDELDASTSKEAAQSLAGTSETSNGDSNIGRMCHKLKEDVAEPSSSNKDVASLLEKTEAQNQLELGNHLMEHESRSLNEKAANAEELGRDDDLNQSKEFKDIMKLFIANRDLLLKFLHDPHFVFTDEAQKQKAPNRTEVLSKSDSFPATGWSQRNNLPFLDDKQKEHESVGKEEKNSQHVCEAGAQTVESTSASPQLHSEELNNQKTVRTVTRHFNLLKNKIKDIIKENKKEQQRISMDSILHKIPYGDKVSQNERIWQARHDKYITKSKFGKTGLPSSSGKHQIKSMRKSHSLTETLGRYSQLFETVSGTAIKPDAEVPKPNTEVPIRKPPKTLLRIFSLPEIQSLSLSKDVRNEVPDSQSSTQQTSDLVPGTALVDICDPSQMDSVAPLTCNKESVESEELRNHSVKENASEKIVGTKEKSGSSSEQVKLEAHTDENVNIIDECKSYCSLDGDHTDVPSIPGKVVVADSQDQEYSPSTETDAISKATELQTLKRQVEEPDLMIAPEVDYSTDASLEKDNVEQPFDELPFRELTFSPLSMKVDKREEAEFKYVKNILVKSGFGSEKAIADWYLPDQPVDPSLFEEEEEYFSRDLRVDGYDTNTILMHMLLFDLINEVLLQTYDTSFVYCPRILNADCHIRPLPVGYRVLEEVWTVISKHLSYQLQVDQTVESIVARDFMKNDGWMNLQHDTEYVGLDLEDLFLEDLIDEIVLDFCPRSHR